MKSILRILALLGIVLAIFAAGGLVIAYVPGACNEGGPTILGYAIIGGFTGLLLTLVKPKAQPKS